MSSEYYTPDLGKDRDSPFARDADGKLVRRAFWLDMGDRSLVLALTQGVGAHLPNCLAPFGCTTKTSFL
mgnify:CR=1 FL=1